jgi:hypothetical protein
MNGNGRMNRVLKWCAIAAGVVAGVIGVMYVVGMTLPVKHQVAKSEAFAMPAPALWNQAVITFHRTNDGSYAIIDSTPPSRFVTRIIRKDLPFGGTWTYEFVPHGAGTTLTITERGEVYNPFFRFVSRFIVGQEGSIDRYFTALRGSARSESAAQP